MAFRQLNLDHLARFNSSASSKFLDKYESYVDSVLIERSKEKSHKTFAPSAFRCDRRSWFRLRGVDPDEIRTPDRVMDFSAEMGTACHRMIQTNLKNLLKENWIDVSEYLKENLKIDSEYRCERDESGLETLIEIDNPPVRFACDGIVKIDGQYYLLEIKSSEYSSWNDLTDPKPHHVDQVKCYCTLLNLDKVIFMYIDRQYGGIKCFEESVTSLDKINISERFEYVQRMVESNLAPEGLPVGDRWCTPNMCPYYKKCQEYGR